MPSIIRVLDETTINQIAAGEVIENPSSVVKELVENAIDAKASSIEIEILGGGRELIRVTDNGIGMEPDDAFLCFERHATSKICSAEELQLLGTLGFRGEALPSIASISKVTLKTAPKGSQKGTLVIIEGGKMVKQSEVHAQPGTTFEIKTLFYNVPVRRQFQKSPQYDANAVQKMVTRLGLAHPEIAFSLKSNGQILIQTRSGNAKQRTADLLGDQFMKSTLPIEASRGPFHLSGFIGRPSETRSNRVGQILLLNGRSVEVPALSLAVKQGYGTLIDMGRFPLFTLFLTLPPGLIDPNVHPQKKEVRLRKSEEILDFVRESVSRSFERKQPIPRLCEPPAPAYQTPKPLSVPLRRSFPTPPERPLTPSIHLPRLIAPLRGFLLLDPLSCQDLSLSPIPEAGDLILMDQRAAHERVHFEQLLKRLETRRPAERQPLLIPQPLELLEEERELLDQCKDSIELLGYTLTKTGNSFSIIASPVDASQFNLASMIRDLLASDHTLEHGAIAKAASQNAIKRNLVLSQIEAEELIRTLFACKTPLTSVSGKPILAVFPKSEITQRFR